MNYCIAVTLVGVLILFGSVTGADWPTWWHDANRGGATTEILPDHSPHDQVNTTWILMRSMSRSCWER
ncbi:MAG: hypothetical protein KAH23_06755 [Kiritimatiellae bacterium]|nr:hypothetical protein [Kiritimatiellia bacterium]